MGKYQISGIVGMVFGLAGMAFGYSNYNAGGDPVACFAFPSLIFVAGLLYFLFKKEKQEES